MKLNKKLMAATIAGTLTLGGMAVGAAQKTETVQRQYRNIQVNVDGAKEIPANEPFLINGSVYVGLRDAANLVGADVAWDGATSTVQIQTEAATSGELEALRSELGSKNLQLATANSKIKELEEKLTQYEELEVEEEDDKEDEDETDDINLSALEDFLEDEYQDEFRIDWTFDLSGNENRLILDLEYEGDRDHDEYKDVDIDDIEDFVEDICDDIQKEVEDQYGIEHIEIRGSIHDVDAREDRVDFEMDDKGRFEFEDKDAPELDEEEIQDYVAIIDSNYMDFPKVNLNGFDSNSIRITGITAEVDGDEIIFEVWTDMDDYLRGAWDRLNDNDADDLEDYMEELSDELEGEFEVNARGFVYDAYEDEMASYNGSLKLH